MSFTLGPFAIREDGVLEPREPELRPVLRFDWRGRRCEAAIGAERISIAAIAARVPSTAEPGADRPRAFQALSALPPALPQGWRLRLMPDHRVRLEADTPLPHPATATGIISAMVRFVLELDPYLDRLESEGVRMPRAA
jgi:hypothetical protein